MGLDSFWENGQVLGVKKIFSTIVDTFLSERLRWPLWIPVLMGGGVGAYFFLKEEPSHLLALATTGVLAFIGLLARKRPAVLVLISILLSFSVGFSAAVLRARLVSAPVLFTETGPRMVSGTIRDVRHYPDALVVVLDDVSIEKILPERTPKRVRLRFAGKTPPLLETSQKISVLAALSPPPPPAWPGGYDSRRSLYFQRIGGTGFVLGKPEVENSDFHKGWLGGFRERISRRIKEIDAGPGGQLTDAVLTGNAPVINQQVLSDMRDSGLAHLIAISGMNIGIVAGFVFILLRRFMAFFPAFALRYSIKKWAVLPAIAAATAYTFLAGAPIPALRSLLMTTLVLVGVILDRAALSMNLVAFSAAIILLLLPEALMGASFQLSFSAVIALVAAFDILRGRVSSQGKFWKILHHVGSVAFSSVVAGLATLPFALFHFQRMAFYGVLANMLAVPLTTFVVMPFGFLGMLLYPLGLDRPFFQMAIWGNRLIVADARIVAGWPGAAFNVPPVSLYCLLLFCLGSLWFAIWKGRWRHAGFAVIALSLVWGLVPRNPPDIFLSDDGKRAGIVENGILYASSRRTDGYVTQSWQRQAGAKNVIPWPGNGKCEGPVCCDSLGCVARIKGHVVAFPRHLEALLADCEKASLVVSPWRIEKNRCRSGVLALQDFRQKGSHLLRLEDDGAVFAKTDAEVYGRRPWTGSRKERKPTPLEAISD